MNLIRLICLLGVLGWSAAQAVSIEYTLTDLGGSEYVFEYFPSTDIQMAAGSDWLSSDFLAIYFPSAFYSQLSVSVPPNPPSSLDAVFWADPVAVDVLEPFAAIDGEYQIVAGVNFPNLAAYTFQVKFTWLGPEGTLPGDQLFRIFDADLTMLYEGMTSLQASASPVPEPPTIILTATLLGAIALVRRWNPASLASPAVPGAIVQDSQRCL